MRMLTTIYVPDNELSMLAAPLVGTCRLAEFICTGCPNVLANADCN